MLVNLRMYSYVHRKYREVSAYDARALDFFALRSVFIARALVLDFPHAYGIEPWETTYALLPLKRTVS